VSVVSTIVTNALPKFGAPLGFGLCSWATMRALPWWPFHSALDAVWIAFFLTLHETLPDLN
jgi:hypothetical protein